MSTPVGVAVIAMLDHPSNRNHPNAWFARSYGPLGTNLPFFDGPLALQPGDTWHLRHRVVIHHDDPWQADVPQRYDEYANPPSLTLSDERSEPYGEGHGPEADHPQPA